ncbi:MAG: chorismate mutase [Gemmatimonadetes bacterium]|nr:chorismate mutase [Gemmatimonadota bacterium]
MPTMVRGVRGATTADANARDAVLDATQELLKAMVEANAISSEDIAAVLFTTSPDLVAEFPAVAARRMGWNCVPLMCGHEMAAAHGQPRCIRILVLWNTEKGQSDIKHVYLKEAVDLRSHQARTT